MGPVTCWISVCSDVDIQNADESVTCLGTVGWDGCICNRLEFKTELEGHILLHV